MVLALWSLLLCRHAGQEEVVIGAPYHGRDAAGTEGLIGYFVNMLALRVEAPRGGLVSALLRQARDAAWGAMRHSGVPWQVVVHELLPRQPHDASRNAVFQSMLAWGDASEHGHADVGRAFGASIGVRPAVLGAEHRVAKCELTLDAMPVDAGGIEGSVEFNADLFETASVERLTARLRELAASMACPGASDAGVWALPMLPDCEHELVLWHFNDTAALVSGRGVCARAGG